MCHADLKNENMLSDSLGNIRLIDFSQAMVLSDADDVYQEFKVLLNVSFYSMTYSFYTA